MLLKTTKLEKTEKITKSQKRKIPPGGMGSGLERAYSNFFFITWLQCFSGNAHWSLLSGIQRLTKYKENKPN